MSSSRRRGRGVEFPPAGSVLDELYDNGDAETDTPPTSDGPVSNTSPPPVGGTSATPRTLVHDATDTTVRPAAGGNRTPEGMTRHTLYIARETADQLDAAAARLQTELGGLVPKHRILAALIAAGVNQAAAVSAGLRAELLHNLGP